ncbi:MAG: DNA translocase FtsK 4TM domain-containing protein [Spirochaetales bacterium]|nr:DNA translocase FtsK 4TM domain-containing protein [Spirochaetales bacterium]
MSSERGFGLTEILSLFFAITGLLLTLALFSFELDRENLIGVGGYYAAYGLFFLFGSAAGVAGPYLTFTGLAGLYRRSLPDIPLRLLALITLLCSLAILVFLLFGAREGDFQSGGGIFGRRGGHLLTVFLGAYGALILALSFLVCGLFLGATMQPLEFLKRQWSRVDRGEIFHRLRRPQKDSQKKEEADDPVAAIKKIEEQEMDEPMKKTPLIERVLDHKRPWLMAAEAGEGPRDDGSLKESSEGFVSGRAQRISRLMGELSRPEKSGRLERPVFSGFFSDDESNYHFQEPSPVVRPARVETFQDPDFRVGVVADFATARPLDPTRLNRRPLSYRSYDAESKQSETADEAPLDEWLGRIAEDAEEESFPPEVVNAPEHLEERDDAEASLPAQLIPVRSERPLTEAPAAAPAADNEPVPYPREALRPLRAPGLRTSGYYLPPELLDLPQVVSPYRVDEEIARTRTRLATVLRDFNIQAEIVSETRGPVLTRYEIKLDSGIKVSRIAGLSDEIRMNLAATSVRIVAPIPGRSTIGIEVPNQERDAVTLGQMVRLDPEFFQAERKLSIAAGKDINGENHYVDLARLPHLLIAGATGAGKSVYMNAVIASLMYRLSPQELRFIMIDPKFVELSLYEGIPHLLMPVITDVNRARLALAWAVEEMDRRYMHLAGKKARDIASYNQKMPDEAMPYIVILIDELADLMMMAAREVEDSIIRLTQKARAVGIHVVMATQRPSVDVITALIKANCPARLAFHVAQRTDSRTILDMNGAETLLGRGDMLYKSPSATGLLRIQAPLISEAEIEKVVREARKFGSPQYVVLEEEKSNASEEDYDGDEGDLDTAWQIIQESGKTSISYLQRRMSIGYNRAARLIEALEEKGYLSPALGSKPREILKRD